MKTRKIYPIITTSRLTESREFYTGHLDFVPVFENDWYLHLRARENPDVEIAFLKPGLQHQYPLFTKPCSPEGLSINLEVDDVDESYARLKNAGVPMLCELKDELWGEHHFFFADPNGIVVNILSMTAPASPEYSLVDAIASSKA